MNFPLLRLLDANANRAREALRVLEDYARFALDDKALAADLKAIRHDLTAATAPFLPEAILHRDTPHDVGTTNKTPAELKRADLADVVTAAGKRLGEALRAMEEFTKITSPPASARLESIRYRFYDVEQRLARTLPDRRRPDFSRVRLCVLITESACKLPWLRAAEQAIAGGADCLQLREKTLDAKELLRRARLFADLCRKHHVISILNDRPDVALLADTDGVHLGQDDLPPAEARKLLGPTKLIGVSTHEIAHARQAILDGADYLGVGPVFKSATKPRDIHPGLPYARQVANEIPLPALAIAGITEQNADQVLATGIQGLAVTASVTGTNDPRSAAARLKAMFPPPAP
jgi:thiamine-phosphate pyrophosphorylase